MVLQCIKPCRGKKKNLTALKSNSNTLWFNFQTYIVMSLDVDLRKWEMAIDLRIGPTNWEFKGHGFWDWTLIRGWGSIWFTYQYILNFLTVIILINVICFQQSYWKILNMLKKVFEMNFKVVVFREMNHLRSALLVWCLLVRD